MANGIRTGDPSGFNKGRSSKFRVGFRVRQSPEKAGRHIGRNVLEITIKMKTKVRKPLMIKMNKMFIIYANHKKILLTKENSQPI